MFSHTIKGQEYNLPLLSRFLTGGDAYATGIGAAQMSSPSGLEARLVDYELLTDEDGKRTVAFGWFAGGKLLSILKDLYQLEYMLSIVQLPALWKRCPQWQIPT